MAVSRKIKNNRNVTITVTDASGYSESVAGLTAGDAALSDFLRNGKQHEIEIYQVRGNIIGANYGARKIPTFTVTLYAAEFTDNSGSGCIIDLLSRTGKYGDAVSTFTEAALDGYAADTDDVYTVDIEYRIDGTPYGDSSDQVWNIRQCYLDTAPFAESEGAASTFSLSFQVLGDATRA